jgi:hypothetical protein
MVIKLFDVTGSRAAFEDDGQPVFPAAQDFMGFEYPYGMRSYEESMV